MTVNVTGRARRKWAILHFSRIVRRPVTDLSGGKASEDSFTARRDNFAVADAVDFQFDSFLSGVALGSTIWLGLATSG